MLHRFHDQAPVTDDPVVYVMFESHGPLGELIRMTPDQVVAHLRPNTCKETRGLLQQLKGYKCTSERILCMVGDDPAREVQVRSDVLRARL